MDNINIWTTTGNSLNSLSSAVMAICAVINIIILLYRKEKKEDNNHSNVRKREPKKGKKEGAIPKNERKTRPEFYIILASLFLIIALSIMQLVNNNKSSNNNKTHPSPGGDSVCMDTKQSKDTLLVFAGGGSVRNYLHKKFGIDVRTQLHSINLAIASGSAWRVLAEEYQFRQLKDNDSLNRFTTICLSAGKMFKEFYDEYMCNMEGTIVAEVYLGDDNLVAYISNDLANDWNIPISDSKKKRNEIPLDVLAQKLNKYLIESNQEARASINKISIFTTNKLSGTLEAYKNCFNDLKKCQDSLKRDYINLEEMIENKQVYIYYDNMMAEQIINKVENGDI